ncbi:unnamed protein product, partial [marine sediment metagenome]
IVFYFRLSKDDIFEIHHQTTKFLAQQIDFERLRP